VRVSLGDDAVVAGVRADIGRLDQLVAGLDLRMRLLGGSARALTRDRGVVMRLPMNHSV
jgi:hypothetical protein